MHRRIDEHWLFWREFRETFHTTGAILPSGTALARALTRFVAQTPSPRHILEAGPGTGAVTRALLPQLGQGDRLELVEINPRFAADLERRLAHDPRLAHQGAQVEVHCQGVEQFPGQGCFDLIISGLPLNNFQVPLAGAILEAFTRLLKPGGTLSFFEYQGVRRAKSLVARGAERQRLQGIDRLLGELLGRHEIQRDSVWWNVPPAWVHHVRPAETQ